MLCVTDCMFVDNASSPHVGKAEKKTATHVRGVQRNHYSAGSLSICLTFLLPRLVVKGIISLVIGCLPATTHCHFFSWKIQLHFHSLQLLSHTSYNAKLSTSLFTKPLINTCSAYLHVQNAQHLPSIHLIHSNVLQKTLPIKLPIITSPSATCVHLSKHFLVLDVSEYFHPLSHLFFH